MSIAAGNAGPLLGRDAETGLLASLLDGIGDGGGALVLSGEPGIGKSRLLAVAAGAARGRGLTVVTTTGVQSEAHLAFAGLHQLLRPLRFHVANLPAAQRAEQLMKARERQMSLGLHSGRAQHREAAFARELSGHGQKPGLADSRLAVQHERAAAIADAIKQRGQQLDLGVPAEQRPGVAHSGRHQGTILPHSPCCRNLRHELSQMTYATFVHRGIPS